MVSRWTSVCPSVRLSYVRPSVFLLPDDNLSKCQWIFIKLDMCINIVELSAHHMSIFLFPDDNLRNGLSPNLLYAFVSWMSGLGSLMDKFR